MSTQVSTSVNLWRPVSKTDRVPVRQRGRVCAQDGCDTILSVYNPAKLCAVHAKAQSDRRGQTQALRQAACESCGSPFQTRNMRRRYCSDRCRMAAFARRKRAAKRYEPRLREQMAESMVRGERQLVADAA